MAVQFQHSQVIDRPVADVFHFFADDHVRNHPRWDPDIELEQITSGQIRTGTVLRRRNRRSGALVEGTMEVVEYEPNRVMATIIRDGPVVMHGRATFEAINDHQTKLTISIEFPDMDESMDRSFLNSRLEQTAKIRKQLMESEIPDKPRKV